MDLFIPGRVTFLLPIDYKLPAACQTTDEAIISKILTVGAEYYETYDKWVNDKQESERYASLVRRHQQEKDSINQQLESKYSLQVSLLTAEKLSLQDEINKIREELHKFRINTQESADKEVQRRISIAQDEIYRLKSMIAEHDQRSAEKLRKEEEVASRLLAEKDKRFDAIQHQLHKSDERRRELEDLLLQKTKTLASSQRRGAEGEQEFETLAKEIGFADIRSTGKEIHMCDYRTTVDGVQVFFEIKNHEVSIANDQVIKFLRDMKEHPEIGAGVFLAMNAPLPGSKKGKKLVIEWLDDNRPMIYVGEFMKEDPSIFLEIIHHYLTMIAHLRRVYDNDDKLDMRLEFEAKIRRATQAIESLAERNRILYNKLTADRLAMISAYDSSIGMVRMIREEIKMIFDVFLGREMKDDETSIVEKPKKPRKKAVTGSKSKTDEVCAPDQVQQNTVHLTEENGT
jgi:hypothetical protein